MATSGALLSLYLIHSIDEKRLPDGETIVYSVILLCSLKQHISLRQISFERRTLGMTLYSRYENRFSYSYDQAKEKHEARKGIWRIN